MNYPDDVRRLPDDELSPCGWCGAKNDNDDYEECPKCEDYNLCPECKYCHSCQKTIDEDSDECSTCGGHANCGDSYCNLCCECTEDEC